MEGNDKQMAGQSPAARYEFMLLSFFAIAIYTMGITAAHANLGDGLCNAVWLVVGTNFGAGLGSIAVLVVGISASLGKVSWPMAVLMACGVAAVFGAPVIAGDLFDSSCGAAHI